MKFARFLLLLAAIQVEGSRPRFRKIAAENKEYIAKLQRREIRELRCLRRIDNAIASRWKSELNKIPTSDLGKIPSYFEYVEPSKPKYNTVLQEWLMDNGDAMGLIDRCFRKIVREVVPSLKESEVKCLNKLFSNHTKTEEKHARRIDESTKRSAREQLPFRRFLSFGDFVELLYQNRNPDALEPIERTVYEHAESYLSSEEDKNEKTFAIEQECEWQNARALREAPNANAIYREFRAQVRDSSNKRLANELMLRWNLSEALSSDKYERWLEARRETRNELKREVRALRRRKLDAQTLCEYATKMADRFAEEQASILVPNEEPYRVELRTKDVASKVRSIEKILTERGDVRRSSMDSLAKSIEEDSMCLEGFSELVQNHQRFDVASAFLDARYPYPELFCKRKNVNLGLIGTVFCKCVGTFCVSHALAALFADAYVLTEGPNGIYRIEHRARSSGNIEP